MTQHYSEIAFTPSVKEQQERLGSRAGYAARDTGSALPEDVLGPEEASFIMAQDSFYIASVSETGWPYIQHRGGPSGFVQVLNDAEIAFPDFRGNRQYISLGNLAVDNRVSLFFMDYARKARIKIMGRARSVDLAENSQLAEALALPGYKAKVERAIVIAIEAFDWNCPQHITPRYTEAQVMQGVAALQQRIAELEAELAAKS
jgi:uncharacterized protein